MKRTRYVLPTLAIFLASAGTVFAHASVSPKEVGVAKYQTFSLGVPVEQQQPTIAVRLVIPDGVVSATPNVKPGWKIDIKKDGEGHDAKVKEVSWTGGSIGVGLRDEFVFSAKTPDKEGEIAWKAYQTYADGSVVAWELGANQEQPKDATGKADFSKFGPASVTKIVNDLVKAPVGTAAQTSTPEKKQNTTLPTAVSVAALAIAGVAWFNTRKKA